MTEKKLKIAVLSQGLLSRIVDVTIKKQQRRWTDTFRETLHD